MIWRSNLADAAVALRAGLPGQAAEKWRRTDVHELLSNVYNDVAKVMQTDVLISGRDVGDHGGDLSKIMTPTKSGYAPPLRAEAPQHEPSVEEPPASKEAGEKPTTPESKMSTTDEAKELTEKLKARAEAKAETDQENSDREAHKAEVKADKAAKATHPEEAPTTPPVFSDQEKKVQEVVAEATGTDLQVLVDALVAGKKAKTAIESAKESILKAQDKVTTHDTTALAEAAETASALVVEALGAVEGAAAKSTSASSAVQSLAATHAGASAALEAAAEA